MEIKKITTLETFKVIGARKNLFTYNECIDKIINSVNDKEETDALE